MAASDGSSDRVTLPKANRRKLNHLENHFQDQLEELEEEYEARLNELEAQNAQLRRELAELKDGGDF